MSPLTGFPLWSCRKAGHRSRWPRLPPMGRLGRRHHAKAGLTLDFGSLIICLSQQLFCVLGPLYSDTLYADTLHTDTSHAKFLQMSLCFNMRYTALDSWSEGQKTILRLFQVKNKLRFEIISITMANGHSTGPHNFKQAPLRQELVEPSSCTFLFSSSRADCCLSQSFVLKETIACPCFGRHESLGTYIYPAILAYRTNQLVPIYITQL